jgi:hypothetical protein
MPLLAAHLGLGNNSFLILDDEENLSLLNYPYSYDSLNFGHFCTPQKFYEDLFSLIVKDYPIDLAKTKILIVSSLPKEYFSSLKVDSYCYSKDLNLQRDDYSVIYLKRTLDNKDVFKSTLDLPKNTSMDVLSNMYLYDNIIPGSLEDNIVWGHKIISTQEFKADNKENKNSLLFTGPPLTGTLLSQFFKYSLAFSVVSDTGLYTVSLDDRDLLYIVSLIKQFEPEIYSKIAPKISFEKTGQLLKCRGKVECLIKKEFSDQQLYEIDNEDLFVYPLLEGGKAHVYIKGRFCRPMEFEIEGGELGFVIDTRSSEFWKVREKGLLEKYKEWVRNINFIKSK